MSSSSVLVVIFVGQVMTNQMQFKHTWKMGKGPAGKTS